MFIVVPSNRYLYGRRGNSVRNFQTISLITDLTELKDDKMFSIMKNVLKMMYIRLWVYARSEVELVPVPL